MFLTIMTINISNCFGSGYPSRPEVKWHEMMSLFTKKKVYKIWEKC